MTLVYSNNLTDGTTAYGSQVMQNFNNVATLLNTTGLDATYFQAGIITDTQISATAAVALSKLAAGSAAGQLIVTGAASTYTPTYKTITGDVTLTSGGVTAIGAGKVTNAMLAGSIAYSNLSLTGAILDADLAGSIDTAKLGTLANGKILMGNGSNVAAAVTPSGDFTMTNAGVATIGAAKITPGKLATGATETITTAGDTTSSTSYADLSAGANPTRSVTIGANGLAIVLISASISNNNAGSHSQMSFAVSGATTVAAADSRCIDYAPAVGTQATYFSGAFLVSGLTAGANTFLAKYKVSANTGTFLDRRIAVIPL